MSVKLFNNQIYYEINNFKYIYSPFSPFRCLRLKMIKTWNLWTKKCHSAEEMLKTQKKMRLNNDPKFFKRSPNQISIFNEVTSYPPCQVNLSSRVYWFNIRSKSSKIYRCFLFFRREWFELKFNIVTCISRESLGTKVQ